MQKFCTHDNSSSIQIIGPNAIATFSAGIGATGPGGAYPAYNLWGEQAPNFVAHASLLHDEWLRLDSAVMESAQDELRAVNDLIAAGCTEDLGGLGVILTAYQRMNNANTKAVVSMNGAVQGNQFMLDYDQVTTPVPIYSVPWGLPTRLLQSSRRGGHPLDVSMGREAARLVATAMEETLFFGQPGIVVEGQTIYGYLTFPDRNTVTGAAPWTDRTNRNILGDVTMMLQALLNDNHTQPAVLYVPRSYWVELGLDYSDVKGSLTWMDRIKAFPGISDIRMSTKLPPNTTLLVELVKRNVDWAVAADMTSVEWSQDPMTINNNVFSAGVPRLKSDRAGQCGFVVCAPA